MPCWTDWTPRFGVAYDLFGNARTALKASVNKYMAGQTLGFAQRYNPFSSQSDVRSWADLNGDDVAQDNEIAAIGNNVRFGQPVLTRRPARRHRARVRLGVQRRHPARADARRVGDRGLVSPRQLQHDPEHQRAVHARRLRRGECGEPASMAPLIPAYNLNSAKQGQVDRVDVNCHRRQISAASHTPGSSSVPPRDWDGRRCSAGGRSIARPSNHCDELENWGNLSGVYYDASGNNSQQPKSDYAFCNQSEQGLPFLHEFKLSGSYQLPWEIQVNAALQSYSGPQLATRWNIGRTTRYASNCLAPCVPGALVIPNMTATNYILDLVAARNAVLRSAQPARSRLPEDLPHRPVSVLRSGGFLQLPQRGLREDRRS